MAIVNRTKDASEQRVVYALSNAATATGVTLTLGIVPYPCVIDEAQIAVWGLSGAPGYNLFVNRFIAGTGFTTIKLVDGASCLPAEFGTSGIGSFGQSMFGSSGAPLVNASGSTINTLLANDILIVSSAGANTAVKGLAIQVVLRPTQDVKVHYGLV